ncbi:MAG: hypothetical protein ACOY33_08955 [Pseudomonadota bacterium]
MHNNVVSFVLRISGIALLSLSVAGCFHVPPVYKPDTASLRQALQQGGSPDEPWHGWTPLNYVVYGASPQNKSPWMDRQTQMTNARLLLEAGANPNALGYGMGTKMPPLILAARQCQSDLVQLLLDHGADPYAMVEIQGTALSMATAGFCATVDDQYRLARTLLDHVERTQGRDAMVAYARMTAPKTVRFLPAPVLHMAVWQKYYGVLAALIEKRVDLDQIAPVGMPDQQWTALHLAEAVGSTDIAMALRRGGARDDVLSNRGETPVTVRGRYVPKQVGGVAATVELAKIATQVQTGDLLGMAKNSYSEQVKASMYEPTRAIERSEFFRRSLGGPVYPPPGWTGLEDAIRKAREAGTPQASGATR